VVLAAEQVHQPAVVEEEEKKEGCPSTGTTSLLQRFGNLSFQSPAPSRTRAVPAQVVPRDERRLSLTPIIEEMTMLRLTSTPRRERRVVDVGSESVSEEEEGLPSY
jgi:hypothetical protein